jgi:hypothetical protein
LAACEERVADIAAKAGNLAFYPFILSFTTRCRRAESIAVGSPS